MNHSAEQSQMANGKWQSCVVPVVFLDEVPLRKLAVNMQGLYALLNLDDGRKESAKRKAVWRFCTTHGIKPDVGGNYSVWKVQQALRVNAETQRARRPQRTTARI